MPRVYRRLTDSTPWFLDRPGDGFYTLAMSRLGLLGGSFDPIHFGHLIVARAIREELSLDTVTFLPSRQPPHKQAKSLAAPEHRAAMVKLAIDGETGFDLSNFDLLRDGPCYSIDTIAHFRQTHPGSELFWIIGADSLMELPTWHRAVDLIAMCIVIIAARTGDHAIDWSRLAASFGDNQARRLQQGLIQTPVIDISSTQIRGRVRTAKSIRYLVPESVRAYIEQNQLYR